MVAKPIGVIIDNDPDFLEFARVVLLRAWPECEVLTFVDSIKAFGFVTRSHIDLLITDVRMPILDGLGLTAALRAKDSQLPIIVVSGEDRRDAARAHGANAFVAKESFLADLGSVLDELTMRANS